MNVPNWQTKWFVIRFGEEGRQIMKYELQSDGSIIFRFVNKADGSEYFSSEHQTMRQAYEAKREQGWVLVSLSHTE